MSRSGLVVSAFLLAGVVGSPIAFAEKPEKKVEKKADKKAEPKADKKSDKKADKSDKSAEKKASSKKSDGATKSAKSSGGGKKSGGGKATAKRETRGGKSARKGGVATRTLTRAVTSSTRMDAGPTGFTWPPTQKMMDAEKACQARLDLAGVPWRPAPQEGRMASAIIVDDMTFGGVRFMDAWNRKGPHKLDCQLAVAFETVGTDLYALGVREAHFSSLFRWSNVRAFGRTVNVLSRHSYGLAMDVVSFRDATGRAINIQREYPKGDKLLHDIEKTINESKKFRILLTPRNDPASHSDHYHFEAASNFTAPAPTPPAE